MKGFVACYIRFEMTVEVRTAKINVHSVNDLVEADDQEQYARKPIPALISP